MKTRRALSVVLAVAVALSAVLAGAALVEDRTSYPASPVGESNALGVTGAVVTGVVIGAVACSRVKAVKNTVPVCGDAPSKEELEKADALETHKEVYGQLSTQRQNNENTLAVIENRINDSRSIALMEGKQAYIRALDNGSSMAAAQVQATEAVEDWYAQRQIAIINQWRTSHYSVKNGALAASNQSGLSMSAVITNDNTGTSNAYYYHDAENGQTITHQLVNGSTREVSGYSWDANNNPKITIKTNNGESDSHLIAMQPTDSFTNQTIINDGRYRSAWTKIQHENQNVTAEVENFVNGTYDNYQTGDISTEDLVDPYLSARDYSPSGNYGTWALRQQLSLGVSPPDNLSSVGSMVVSSDGQTYEGVLLSDGLPSGDEFEVGQSYNPDNLTGPQLVVDRANERTVELDNPFSIDSAQIDGQNQSTVGYRTIEYNHFSLDGYKKTLRDLDNLTAQLNARQQQFREGTGGGGLFASSPLGPLKTIVVLGFVGIILVGLVTRS